MDALSFRPQPSPFRPQTHEHRRFQYGQVMNDRSVSTSNGPPQAAQPRPHLQTYFPPSAPPSFKPHFADSPYSSGSSSSFPTESPPAEPHVEMESDYTPIVSSPDDLRYSYPAFDQSDPSDWGTKGLSALSVPYNTDAYAQQPMSAPPTMPMSWPSDAKKFQPQQYQQQQQQRVNYPSFSGQMGRVRSLSDGTPSGSGSNANGMNSLYTQPLYSDQNGEDFDLVYPQDADIRLMDNGPNTPGHGPFPSMHSYPQEQQQQEQPQRSPQPVRVKRELRSMSDAAAPPMRPPMYTSSSQPSAFGSFGLTMHRTSSHTTTFHSSGQDNQSHAGYAPQHQVGTQHNTPISMPMPMPMPMPMYGSLPTYNFNEQVSSPSAGYSSGGHTDQNSQISEELSPMMRFQQMEIQGGQGGCDPRYLNGNMGGTTGSDGDAQSVHKTSGIGAAKQEEDETKEYVAGQLGTQMDEGVEPKLSDAEGDEDVEPDDDRDGDYQTGDDDDDDGDGEYLIRSRRTAMSTNTHSLRPRRRSSSDTRYQPYSLSSNRSTSPAALKSNQDPSSQPTPRLRMRSRQAASLPVPVPVPNLTKKSRGRRVPTVDSLATAAGRSVKGTPRNDVDDAESKNARTYTCDAAGCGKCFARGEHLKRHVRSIHTYEKPHRCPFPGCEKDFSRHDNLRQHLRVHKGFQPRKDEYQGDSGEKW